MTTTITTTTTITSTNPKLKVLSALSPEFIPMRDCVITDSLPKSTTITVLEKIPSIPRVFPTFSKRPPIPTPNESLTDWIKMDYSEFDLKPARPQIDSPPSPPSSSASSSSSSSASSSTTSTNDDGHKAFIEATLEEDFQAYKSRLLRQEDLRYAQEQGANAARAAAREKKMRDSGIVEVENKISDKEVWLWEHPTLGAYRCLDPSPLRRCMILV